MDAACSLCRAVAGPALYADGLWHLAHIEPPWGVAGWMVLAARRHVRAIAELDDGEAADLGVALRHCARVLTEVTGAERVYVAALGEMVEHVHVHLVPRLPAAAMPKAARGFAVFDLQRAAQAGEIAVDPREVERVSAAYAAALAREPIVR